MLNLVSSSYMRRHDMMELVARLFAIISICLIVCKGQALLVTRNSHGLGLGRVHLDSNTFNYFLIWI